MPNTEKSRPKDIDQFLRHLRRDFGDFFEPGKDIVIVRAPARLDVMGGIADYSGSVVLEAPLGEAVVLGLQKRADKHIRIFSLGIEKDNLKPQFESSLSTFFQGKTLKDYPAVRGEFAQTRGTAWAGYIAGAFYVLLKEEVVTRFAHGANIGLVSNIPLGAGISSSAAIEIATMQAINFAYHLGMEGLQMAKLAQIVENHVVGAPCGIMDQVTSALGEAGKLLALKCQPHDILGFVELPPGARVVGINSNVKHEVAGHRYTDTRVGTFMGHKIILSLLTAGGKKNDPYHGYLCNITPDEYVKRFRQHLPTRMGGKEFLRRYGPTIDSVTRVLPGKVYPVRIPTEHPIYENSRVLRFLEVLERAKGKHTESNLRAAGHLMYGSHFSYSRCGLGARETDLLVTLVRQTGPEKGLYGAKITGGGSGGTVAILAATGTDALLQEIAAKYHSATRLEPQPFLDSSPGALEFGHELVRI